MRALFVIALLALSIRASEELPKAEPGHKKYEAAAPRSRAEVDAVLKQSAPLDAEQLRTLHVLLLAGPKDHGVGEHDYPLWQKNWQPLLQKSPRVIVDTAFVWPTPEQLKAADLMVCFLRSNWDDEQLKAIDTLLERGGGVVLIHWAVSPAKGAPKEFAERFGMAYTSTYYRHGPMELTLQKPEHPILKGLPQKIEIVDEAYWPMLGDASKCEVLATSSELIAKGGPLNAAYPQIWTRQHEKGRAFCMVPGHFNFSFNDPFFRLLLLRGMAWAAGEPVQRFEALATEGLELK